MNLWWIQWFKFNGQPVREAAAQVEADEIQNKMQNKMHKYENNMQTICKVCQLFE